LANGKLKEETLAHKAKVEESWGDATLRAMKFCAWLKDIFKNFHKLNYDVLVKLEECWWKVNAHEITSFACWSYEASNAGDTQDNHGHEERRNNPTPEPSVCKIRRFEMMKYSFNDDKEYIAIKEFEYLNHSKDNLDYHKSHDYRELLRIIDEGWVVATPDDE
ncbi:hypothetical protein Tco_0324323, partial [Tanacetum coccineum]